MRNRTLVLVLSAAFALALFAGPARAAFVSVNIDGGPGNGVLVDVNDTLDNTHGVFADDDSSYIWNRLRWPQTQTTLETFTASSLEDTDGTTTAIGLSLTYRSDENNWSPVNGVLDRGVHDNNADGMTLTISGLVVGGQYDLVVFDCPPYPTETQTVEGNAPTSFSNELVGATDYTDGGTYVYWNATADGSGELHWVGSGDFFDTLTGFQIRLIPEPSSLMLSLLALAALAFVGRRRRV